MSDSQREQSAAETRAAEILLSGALRPTTSSDSCPSAEALAAFVDGRGTAAERAVLAEHIETCEACSAVVGGVADLAGEVGHVVAPPLPGQARRRPFGEWLGRHRVASISALAAAAVLVLAVWVGGRWFSPEGRLERALGRMDSSLGEYRPIEPRLTGSTYRLARPATRAATTPAEPSLEVRETLPPVERAARSVSSLIAARALAKMHLFNNEPEAAVEAVAPFVGSTTDAAFLSDAAAAYLVRGRAGDSAQALDAAERAVRSDPRFAASWFNYGLAAEALGLSSIAAQAWDQVIKLEPDSGWAREAAERKANAPKRKSWQPQDKSEFSAALERGDDAAAARVGDRSLADARVFFESTVLPSVANVWNAGNRPALVAALARAEAAARALGQLSQDRWASDLALQLRAIVDRGRTGSGRTACIPVLLDVVRLRSIDQWSDAEARLVQGTSCTGDVPEALVLHSAFVRLRNAASTVRPAADLTRQLADVAATAGARGYFILQGRALRTQAVLLSRQAKRVEALDRSIAAEAAARLGQDLDGEISNASLVGELNDFLGARETAWRERERALNRIYAVASPLRRFTIYHDAIRALVDGSLNAAALRLLDIALADLSGLPDFSLGLLADRAALLSRIGRRDEAKADVRAALDLVPRSGTSAAREGFQRTALRSQAMVALHDDPATAVDALTILIETGDPKAETFQFAELLFLRAGAYAGQSDLIRADQDFRKGFDLVEQRQLSLPDHLQPAAFDRIWDAAAAAIRLHAVARSDPWSALLVAERARAATLTSRIGASRPFEDVEGFRRQLPSDLGVVFVSALDDSMLSWGMARDVKPSYDRVAIPYPELADLAKRFRDALRSGSRELYEPLARRLYDMVLAPHGGILSQTSVLAIIPDGPLLAAPFAALVGPSGRFLVEDRPVIIAPNLRLLGTLSSRLQSRPAAPSAIAVGNPTRGPGLPWRLSRLDAAEDEAQTVAEIYGGAPLVRDAATKPAFLDALQRSHIVHFAGHAVVNTTRSENSSLVLAPSNGDIGLLFPMEIDRARLAPGALIVLAACDTAEGAVFRGEGLMGLVRPFIAAGAASVLANLWPIEDAATVAFSAAFHHQVRAGVTPARALQIVQADFASRKAPAKFWAGWILISGYN